LSETLKRCLQTFRWVASELKNLKNIDHDKRNVILLVHSSRSPPLKFGEHCTQQLGSGLNRLLRTTRSNCRLSIEQRQVLLLRMESHLTRVIPPLEFRRRRACYEVATKTIFPSRVIL